MSRQFRIYLMPADAESLIGKLDKEIGIQILQEKSPTAIPQRLVTPVRNDSIRFSGEGARSIRCYLAPSGRTRVDLEHYDTPDRWVIQPSSEAIEFSGCDYNGRILVIGRLYYQSDKLFDDTIVPKSAEFVDWAESVFRIAKKSLRRSKELDAYIGANAESFRHNGGRFARSIRPSGEPIFDED